MTVETITNILKLFAGIGLFLLAMYLLEESLKQLSGRNFKLFLQRATRNRFGAAGGGAAITGILQSSSMVTLMVLALVGAGVFNMKSGMAVIFGANLGTTLDSWIIATLGFKVGIEVIAYPAVFAGGLLLIIGGERKNFRNIAWLLLGFGLLFIALYFMKSGMEEEVGNFDPEVLANTPIAIFVLVGFLVTLLVQSGSVTIALVLTALNAGAFGFEEAAAIVLGSETGDIMKTILPAIGGTAAKKRVVLGNFFFNVSMTILVLLFFRPILYIITGTFGITDPLIGLVTFSSLINLVTLLLFLVFLDPFTRMLERFYSDSDGSMLAFLKDTTSADADTGVEVFRKETAYFIYNSMLHNLSLFGIKPGFCEAYPEFNDVNQRRKYNTRQPEERYEMLKQHQGELQAFYLDFRDKAGSQAKGGELNQLISAVRSAMHSAKSIKDIGSNISNLKRSSKDGKFSFFVRHKKETEQLYEQLNQLFSSTKDNIGFEDLQRVFNQIQDNYSASLNDIYREMQDHNFIGLDITTILNFNREIFTSNKAMLMAIKDFLLEEKDAGSFNAILVYKT